MGLYQRYDFCTTIRLNDLKSRITAAVTSLDTDTLRSVWDEFNYCLDVVHVVGGWHIEH